MSDLVNTLILGLIEGVTEFLPVSSTGHMELFAAWSSGADLTTDFWKTFIVVIQIGAIAAVVVYFRHRLWRMLINRREVASTPLEMMSRRSAVAESRAEGVPTAPAAAGLTTGTRATGNGANVLKHPGTRISRRHPLVNIIIATLPALIVAALVHKWIEANLENYLVVAWALGLGGIAMLAIEFFRPPVNTQAVEDISMGQALLIGIAQILAVVFPGTSRSAATIMGGMCFGLSRTAAAEFSFFIAIPIMCCATGYKLLDWVRHDAATITSRQVMLLIVGTVVSFLIAWVVIAAFMGYVRKYSFVPFALYRIVLAVVVILAAR